TASLPYSLEELLGPHRIWRRCRAEPQRCPVPLLADTTLELQYSSGELLGPCYMRRQGYAAPKRRPAPLPADTTVSLWRNSATHLGLHNICRRVSSERGYHLVLLVAETELGLSYIRHGWYAAT